MQVLVRGYAKWVLVLVGSGLVLIQAVPVDRSNPDVIQEIKWDSPKTRDLVYAACGDCHTNNTDWPWYSWVAPVSWDLVKHVEGGRSKLNFTEWPRRAETLEEISEMVESGEMPPLKYRLMHRKARRALKEKDALLEGLRRTFEADPPGRRRTNAPPADTLPPAGTDSVQNQGSDR